MLKNLKNKIQSNPYLSSLVLNTGWLFFDRFFRLGLGLIVGVWVARYLGPENFGDINYALAIVTIVSIITTLGLDSIAIREIVNGKDTNTILGTVFISRMVVSIITVLIFAGYIFLFPQISDIKKLLILTFSFLSIFQAFDTIDLYFQSLVKSKFSVYAKNTAFALIAAYRIVMVIIHADIYWFGFAILLEAIIGAILLVYYYQKKNDDGIFKWKFSFPLLKEMLKDSWPLILSSVSIIIYMRLDQIMLGNMSGSKDVGDYSAATRLVEVWYFVPTAVTSSLFPYIVKAKQDALMYEKKFLNLYALLLWGSIIISLVITLTAPFLINILFGKDFEDAIPILQVYVWSIPGTFMGVASSQFLMAENLTRISFLRTFMGMIINIILNLILIPRYGGLGAAIATVFSYSVATISLVFFKSTRSQVILMLRSLSIRRFRDILMLKDR